MWKQPRPRGSTRHDPSAGVLTAQLHHSEHAEEREVKVDVEARADVRARLESPGAAAIARREESRQWPRVACSCLEWLGLSLMALGRSARRSPRGRVAARRVATGRHRRDESNLGSGGVRCQVALLQSPFCNRVQSHLSVCRVLSSPPRHPGCGALSAVPPAPMLRWRGQPATGSERRPVVLTPRFVSDAHPRCPWSNRWRHSRDSSQRRRPAWVIFGMPCG